MSNPIWAIETYDVIFTVAMCFLAFCPWKVLGKITRFASVLFVLFAVSLTFYFLFFDNDTWKTDPAPDDTRYARAVRRSSSFVIIALSLKILLPLVTPIKRGTFFYKYFSIFIIMIMAYVYDRAVSVDDGLIKTKQNVALGVLDGYRTLCSPSFMRFIFIIVIELIVTIGLNKLILPIISPEDKLSRFLIGDYIIPFLVFIVATGPLRFDWAYPNVSTELRLTYVPAYLLVFGLLTVYVYTKKSGLYLLITLLFIAGLLQFGGFSDAKEDYSTDQELIFGKVGGTALATLVLISTLYFSWLHFKHILHKYI